MIHYAKIENSPRLRRTLEALEAAGIVGLTTREVIAKANVCAVNTVMAELKRNDIKITCTPQGKGRDGSNVYRYALA